MKGLAFRRDIDYTRRNEAHVGFVSMALAGRHPGCGHPVS
jgi:hypothetical protein